MSQEIKKEQDTLANARVEYYKLQLIKAESNVKKIIQEGKNNVYMLSRCQ